MDGIDLDDTTVLSTTKAAINNFYGTIFGVNSYSTSIEPNVDAASTFSGVIESLENIFREPLDLYAAYNDAADAHGIDSSGGLFCGGSNTKTHFFPGTTGLSEIGALRDCLSDTLSLSSEPSLETLVSTSMSSVVLAVNSDGDNFLLSDLSSLSIEYTFISSTTSPTFPSISFYTQGEVTGNSTYNWQDIKGCEVELKLSLDGPGSFSIGDTVTVTMDDATDAAAVTTASASFTVSVTANYKEDSNTDDGISDVHDPVSGLTALKALQPPVVGGGFLNTSQLAVYPIIVGDGDTSLLVTECSMVLSGVSHYFTSSDAAPTSVPIPSPTSVPIPTPTKVPIPVPTPVPIPVPTKVPIPAPTKVPIPSPTKVPIPAPTKVPIPSPTKVPISSPNSVPIPAPTKVPIPSPTIVPIPSPTMSPTLDPSPQPSLAPTTVDTVIVEVFLMLSASSAPDQSDKDSLKSSISSQLGVSTSDIRDFSVAYTSRRMRHLLSGTWDVTFEIVVSLSSVAQSSGADFTAQVNQELADTSFQSAVVASITSVDSFDSVASSLVTRSPTPVLMTIQVIRVAMDSRGQISLSSSLSLL